MFMQHSFFIYFLKQVWLWEFSMHCIYLLSPNCFCEHVARCGSWFILFWFSSLRSLRSFSTRHGDPGIISQYQSTVSRSCGPSLLVLRTLEHYLDHWGSKVLQTPLGGEKNLFLFYISDAQSTYTKCYLCINKHLFIYIYIYIYIYNFLFCVY